MCWCFPRSSYNEAFFLSVKFETEVNKWRFSPMLPIYTLKTLCFYCRVDLFWYHVLRNLNTTIYDKTLLKREKYWYFCKWKQIVYKIPSLHTRRDNQFNNIYLCTPCDFNKITCSSIYFKKVPWGKYLVLLKAVKWLNVFILLWGNSLSF